MHGAHVVDVDTLSVPRSAFHVTPDAVTGVPRGGAGDRLPEPSSVAQDRPSPKTLNPPSDVRRHTMKTVGSSETMTFCVRIVDNDTMSMVRK